MRFLKLLMVFLLGLRLSLSLLVLCRPLVVVVAAVVAGGGGGNDSVDGVVVGGGDDLAYVSQNS